MKCFFCESELDQNNEYCNAEPCRFYKVRHVHHNGFLPFLLKVEFTTTYKGRYIIIQYAIMELQEFQRKPELCVFEKESWKQLISLPYPPVTLTPTNHKDKLKTYLLFS